MAADANIQTVIEIVADIDDAVKKLQSDLPNAIQAGMSQAQDRAKEGLDNVQGKLEEAAKKAKEAGEDSGRSFGEGFTLFAAAFATEFLLKLKETFETASAYASELETTARITGSSAAEIQKFSYALGSVGVSADGARRDLTIFQRQVASAAEAHNGKSMIERLGLDPKALAAMNDSTKEFDAVADKVKNLSCCAIWS
jgi:hypothetical protein